MNNRAPILADILDLLYKRYVTGAIMAMQLNNWENDLYIYLKCTPQLK